MVRMPALQPYSTAKANATGDNPPTCVSSASESTRVANASVPTVSGCNRAPTTNSAMRPATCIGPISEPISTASRAVRFIPLSKDQVRGQRRGQKRYQRKRPTEEKQQQSLSQCQHRQSGRPKRGPTREHQLPTVAIDQAPGHGRGDAGDQQANGKRAK